MPITSQQKRTAHMPSVLELQAAMTAYLTSPPGPDVPAQLLSFASAHGDQTAKRFAVYKNNVYARVIDALRDTFPAVMRLVGDEFFRYVAVQYFSKTAPVAGSLLAYAAGFPEFLGGMPEASGIVYLADVARLEHLYLEAYHAADITPDAGDAGGVHSRVLHPSVRLMSSPHQVSRIWELNRGDTDFEDVTLPLQQEYLLIVRPSREVEVHRVRLGEYAMLLALDDGAQLGEVRFEAERAEPQFEFEDRYAALRAAGVIIGAARKAI